MSLKTREESIKIHTKPVMTIVTTPVNMTFLELCQMEFYAEDIIRNPIQKSGERLNYAYMLYDKAVTGQETCMNTIFKIVNTISTTEETYQNR